MNFIYHIDILPPIQYCSDKSLIIKSGQIFIRQFSSSFQAVFRHLIGSHQYVVLVFRQFSGSSQAFDRQSLVVLVFRQLSDNYSMLMGLSSDNQNVINCHLKKGFQILLSLLDFHIPKYICMYNVHTCIHTQVHEFHRPFMQELI